MPPPSEGESEDDQLHPCPLEPQEQERPQETDPEDFETLSHKSESRSDTRTDPFESASDAESFPGDLTGGVCLSPSGPSSEAEAGWGCPGDSAIPLPQGQHLACVEGLRTEEGWDLRWGSEEDSHQSKLRRSSTAATAGRPAEASLCDCVTSLVQESVPGAALCFPQSASCNSSPQLQKAGSRDHQEVPVVWSSFLQHCGLAQSWPHIHRRAASAELPYKGPQENNFPLWIRTKKSAPRPPVSPGLWVHPFLDVACQPRLGTPCLVDTRGHHSVPENLGADGKTPQRSLCQHVKMLVRAHSIAAFPLHCPKEHLKQTWTFGPFLREGTETEPHHPITHNTRSPGPTQLSYLLSTSQSRDLPFQGERGLSDYSFKGTPQDTPCVGLPLENQVEPASRSCPDPSHLTSALLKPGSQEEVPGPAECKPGHSPESRPEEPKGVHPGDAVGKQKCLLNIAAKPGNHTKTYPAKRALSEERKLPDRTSAFPRCCSHGEMPVYSERLVGSPEVSGSTCTPKTTLRSNVTDPSEAAAKGVVLDLQCRGNTLQGLLDFPTVQLSHHSPRSECAPGTGHGGEPLASGQPQAPKADEASKQSCKLIMVAVRQEHKQTSTRKAQCLLESQSGDFREEKGAGPTAFESPRASEMPVCGSECELPGCLTAGPGDGASQLLAQGMGLVKGQVSRTASDDTLSSEETLEEELLGESSGPGSECVHRGSGLQPGGNPESPSPECKQGECGTEGAEDAEISLEWVGEAEAPNSGVLASSHITVMLPFEELAGRLPRGVQESGQCPAFLQMTPVRADRSWSQELPGGDIPSSQALTLEGLNPVHPSSEGCMPHSPCQVELPLHHVHQSVSLETHSDDAHQEIRGGTSGDLGGEEPSSEGCNIKRLKTTESKIRARLALAHKTFTNFFEAKVIEKTNAGSVRGEKGKRRLGQSSWRAFLRSKDVEGSKRPSLVSGAPEPDFPELCSSPQATSGHCEEWTADKDSCVAGESWTPPLSPATLSSSRRASPRASPEHRRKSEPTIKRTAPQESSRNLHSGIFPEPPWLASTTSPGAQQTDISCTLPCSSACHLTYENQGMPCRPTSPKPRSPMPGAQRVDLCLVGRTSAISMVSLRSYRDVNRSSEAPGRPKASKARASLLLSLQTLNQNDQKEDRSVCQCHHGLGMAPLLRDLPGSEVSDLLLPHKTRGRRSSGGARL